MENSTRRHNRAGVLLIAWGHFAHDVFTSFFAPLLPLLRESLGMSYADAGFLVALQRIPALMNPFLGAWADRSNIRWMLIVAPTVTALAMSSIGLAPDQKTLGLLLILSGISSAIWHVPAPVLLARMSGRRMGLGMSLFMVAGEAARSVGPLLALGAVSLWGPEGLMNLVPLGILTSIFLYFTTRSYDGSSASGKSTSPGEPVQSWKPLIRLFAAISLIIASRSFLVGALTTFLPSYVIENGGTLWLGGASLAILQGAGAVGALCSGTLSDRIGRKAVLMIASVGSPLVFLLMIFSPGKLMLPLLLLLGIFAFATNPPIMALIQERARQWPAVANGIYMTLGFSLRSVVVIFVGKLADDYDIRRAFLVSAILAFMAIFGVLALPGREKTSAPEK